MSQTSQMKVLHALKQTLNISNLIGLIRNETVFKEIIDKVE